MSSGPTRNVATDIAREHRICRSFLAMTADVLSEVLSAVRLTGSVFFDVSATAPWVAEAPPSAEITKIWE